MSSIRSSKTVAGLAIILLLVVAGAATVHPDVLTIGAFSSASAQQITPTGWERITFGKIDVETEYNLVRAPDDSTVVLRATSDGGASGLVTRRRIDPNEYPILRWRWRVSNVLEDGNARTKDGDDYAARIYVTFDHDLGIGGRIKRTALKALGYDDIPSRALNYVWANQVDAGQIFPSAYTDWVMMIPVRSGSSDTGRWVTEQRNILEDYRRAFGEDPPAVTGIAIMTDTDNTGGKTTAYYGDIISVQR
ncbi:hypothetical protein CRI94_04635 [Longibacter salinarum]|uniref:DUF3047 domain-containing protein n=1 Tax=Longibacter salinarum TaxID=1850348 RepID=A0A2A8D109_9BACT|nr:DUF3047 domain-containing protein [Longibacter salinarum]PEN14328.1 hypothetical protein CRI94_04635 [Longibacter salinarum]